MPWAPAELGLVLSAPEFRYYAPDVVPEPGQWRGEDRRWEWTDGLLRCQLRAGHAESETLLERLEIEVRTLRPIRVKHAAVQLEVAATHPPTFWSRHGRWTSLLGHAEVPELTPLAVRWNRGPGGWAELRSAGRGPAARLTHQGGVLSVSLTLESGALHPRWHFGGPVPRSTSSRSWDPGSAFTTTLFLRMSGSERDPAVLSSYPAGREAGFVITDHCDFDTTERLQVFLSGTDGARGWTGRGLKLTKGVFAIRSAPRGRAPAPSVEEPEYERVVRDLAADGSEIAPHGVNESGNIAGDVFRRALEHLVERYRPRTWIDHGVTLKYCYTMGGADDIEYDLLGALRRYDFLGLWSYFDVPTEPARGLNLMNFPLPAWRHTAALVWGHLLKRRPLIAAHYLRTATLVRLGSTGGSAVGHALSGMRSALMDVRERRIARAARSVMSGFVRARRTISSGRLAHAEPMPPMREIHGAGPTIYPEHAAGLSQARDDDLFLFTSMEVPHLSVAYTPESLDDLVAQRGLHIGHSYLLNRLPYLAGLFQPDRKEPRLSAEWLGFLDALEEAVADGRLWNPTAGELMDWVRHLIRIDVVPLGDTAVRLCNRRGRPARDLTLVLPSSAEPGSIAWGKRRPDGWRSWGDALAVWGTVPGREEIEVRWGRA